MNERRTHWCFELTMVSGPNILVSTRDMGTTPVMTRDEVEDALSALLDHRRVFSTWVQTTDGRRVLVYTGKIVAMEIRPDDRKVQAEPTAPTGGSMTPPELGSARDLQRAAYRADMPLPYMDMGRRAP